MITLDLDLIIEEIKSSRFMVVDIEATGLELHYDDRVIGIALYFPHSDNSYYLPLAHGKGKFSKLLFTDDIEPDDLSKKEPKLAYLDDYYRANKLDEDYPYIEDISPLFPYWTIPTHIYHNANFDTVGLLKLGFPKPTSVLDTLIAAYLHHTDMYNYNGIGKKLKSLAANIETLYPDVIELDYYKNLTNEYDLINGERDLETKFEAWRKEHTPKFKKYLKDKAGRALQPPKLNPKAHMWVLPPGDVHYYAEMDVKLTWLLYLVYNELLANWSNPSTDSDLTLVDTWYEFSGIQNDTLLTMELNGFIVDKDKAYTLAANLAKELDAIEVEAKEYIDKVNIDKVLPDFNISSNQQLLKALQILGVKVSNVQKSTLLPLVDDIPLASMAIRYRDYQKQLNTYLNKWLGKDNIHPSLYLGGTVTGRLSSSGLDGNFQNIPNNKGSVFDLKSVLRAKDNHVLVEVDYSGLETVIGAWLAETLLKGDKNYTMTRLIESGTNLHTYTRDKVGMNDILLGEPLTDSAVEKYLIAREKEPNSVLGKYDSLSEWFAYEISRFKAKTLNFAIMYGAGARTISNQLGIPQTKAKELLNNWRNTYPAIYRAMRTLSSLAQTYRDIHGSKAIYIFYPLEELGLTPFVRKYHYYDTWVELANGGGFDARSSEAWKAFNSVVQGTAGLITLNAAHKVGKIPTITPINTIHDSIIFSCEEKYLDENLSLVFAAMTDYKVRPKLSVDAKVSFTGYWSDTKDYEPNI